jgi:hypothetical protein
MPALYSNTSGEVYESTIADINLSIAPTTLLPNDHPFRTFFREHLLAVTTPGGSYDALIDAYVAVSTGSPVWRRRASSDHIVAERQNIRRLLRERPPDVVVVDQDASEGYAFHERTPSMWRYICITRHYVDKWMAANDQATKLALEALLKSAFDHEIGHWLNTLVCTIWNVLNEPH